MSEAGVVIEGVDELREGLRKLPDSLERQVERRALRVAGELVRDEARSKIHSPAGHARRGIGYKVISSGRGLYGGLRSDKGMRVYVGPRGKGHSGRAAVFAQRHRSPGRTPPPHAAAVAIARHYGLPESAARPIALAIARRGTPARPIMQGVASSTAPRVERFFADAVDAALRAEFRG